ncbi:hypothetical protein V9K98_31575 [Kribbella sp. CCNWLW197]
MLDLASAGVLLGAAATGNPAVLALFDVRSEAMRVVREVVSSLRGRFRDEPATSRSEKLTAAHTVIVINAYFEAVSSLDLPVDMKELKLTMGDQISLAGRPSIPAQAEMLDMLTSAGVPMPSPATPYEDTRFELLGFFTRMSERLLALIEGLNVRDRLNDTQVARLDSALTVDAAPVALDRYDEGFRRLAADNPEFFLWASLVDHQATRNSVHELRDDVSQRLSKLYSVVDDIHTGLAGMERMLALTATGDRGYAQSDLAIIARQELDWPLVDRASLDTHPQLEFPRLKDGYINPSGRIAEIDERARPGEDHWWNGLLRATDVQSAIAGQLIRPEAFDAPLVILGPPGAGKSLLTKVLHARLSEAGFVAVRVELRHVAPNSPIQTQIEQGILRSTGRDISWPSFVGDAPRAPRVVLLDGFDELLQSTRVNRSDYLELIQEFQARESALGRPTAVVITSRTIVAGRSRFPIGSVAIRLDPFDESQVEQWLRVWNDTNRTFFAREKLQPLPTNVAMKYPSLSEQPLLLLMLALYDADNNSLVREEGNFDSADLYEKLLSRFVRREVHSKERGRELSDDALPGAIERNLQRLSVTAASMFNRGQQWVATEDLNADMSHLLPVAALDADDEADFHERLTEADITVGRFFFIHRSETSGVVPRRTYEFMHATFGEYLTARFVIRGLKDLAGAAEKSSAWNPSALPDDGLIFALLSFQPLSSRAATLDFTRQCLSRLDERECVALRRLLPRIFRRGLYDRANRGYREYRPVDLQTTSRLGIYSVNLFMLITLLADEPIRVSELLQESDPVQAWRQLTRLWQSCTAPAAWEAFVGMLQVDRIWVDKRGRDLEVSAAYTAESVADKYSDLTWILGIKEVETSDLILLGLRAKVINESNRILLDETTDILGELAAQFARLDPQLLILFRGAGEGRVVGVAGDLVRLLTLTSASEMSDLEDAYSICLTNCARIERSGVVPIYLEIVLRALRADLHRLSSDFLGSSLLPIAEVCDRPQLRAEMETLVDQKIAHDPSPELSTVLTELRRGVSYGAVEER